MILSKFRFEKFGVSIRSLAREYDKLAREPGSVERCLDGVYQKTTLSEGECREVVEWLNGVVFEGKCIAAEHKREDAKL